MFLYGWQNSDLKGLQFKLITLWLVNMAKDFGSVIDDANMYEWWFTYIFKMVTFHVWSGQGTNAKNDLSCGWVMLKVYVHCNPTKIELLCRKILVYFVGSTIFTSHDYCYHVYWSTIIPLSDSIFREICKFWVRKMKLHLSQMRLSNFQQSLLPMERRMVHQSIWRTGCIGW